MGESTDKHFVISVIKNFVSDRMKGSTVESVDKVMEDVARDFLDVIRAASIRLPESKFGVVMPLQRPSLPWYQDELLTLRDMLERGLINLKLNNVTRIDCISMLTQTFVDDQIHLTRPLARVLLLSFLVRQKFSFTAPAFFSLSRVHPIVLPHLPPLRSLNAWISLRLLSGLGISPTTWCWTALERRSMPPPTDPRRITL
jgi:hypothetical protein